MIDCGHVFCVDCLQSFYNNAINEGDLVSIRCLAPNCAKKRADAQSAKNRKPKTQLSPSELLQIPLEHEMVTRYVKLKHKAELESDKNTVYCPRKWCQGAARSKKHKKPEGFEFIESEDEEDADDNASKKSYLAGNDLLSVCEDCSYAFCSRCYQGWHGEFTFCVPKQPNGELTEEDKASLEYLKLHTTPCPTCASPAQKTHGCNHMICFKCNTHFCYLCSAWLEPSNPYKHYNMETTGCYMRLWELEAGDGNDVGIGYGGGVQQLPEPGDNVIPEEDEDLEGLAGEVIQLLHNAGPEHREELENAFAEALGGGQEAREALARVPHGQPGPQPQQQEFQREGPLVFRINQVAPPPPPPVPAVPDAPQPARRNAHLRRGNHNQRFVDPRPAGIREAAPFGGARRLVRIGRGGREDPGANAAAQEQEAAHQAWVQRFVQMALNDEEDQLDWDSDDEEDHAAWEIPVR
jgi:E3 ubiquitin-protein ligase RNF14